MLDSSISGHHTMEFFEMCAALISQLARWMQYCQVGIRSEPFFGGNKWLNSVVRIRTIFSRDPDQTLTDYKTKEIRKIWLTSLYKLYKYVVRGRIRILQVKSHRIRPDSDQHHWVDLKNEYKEEHVFIFFGGNDYFAVSWISIYDLSHYCNM